MCIRDSLVNKDSPLAKENPDGIVKYSDLEDYIEIVHGDLSVPSLSFSKVSRSSVSEHRKKRIYVYERGSQFDLLGNLHNTYMWVSPVPKSCLEQHAMVQLKCDVPYKVNKDVLIFPKGYSLSKLDEQFIAELERVKEKIKMDGLY